MLTNTHIFAFIQYFGYHEYYFSPVPSDAVKFDEPTWMLANASSTTNSNNVTAIDESA